jgi:hypothetical protein
MPRAHVQAVVPQPVGPGTFSEECVMRERTRAPIVVITCARPHDVLESAPERFEVAVELLGRAAVVGIVSEREYDRVRRGSHDGINLLGRPPHLSTFLADVPRHDDHRIGAVRSGKIHRPFALFVERHCESSFTSNQ